MATRARNGSSNLAAAMTLLIQTQAQAVNDMARMRKEFAAIREGISFKLQGEFYNAFNRTHLGTPNTTVTSSSFGRITSTFLGPREIQLSGRLTF